MSKSAREGNILLPLISAVAVVAVLAAGYFFLQARQLQKEPSIESQGSSNSNNTNTTFPKSQPVGETTNWKDLNSIYGYTVKYPPSWFASLASSNRLGSIDQIESYDTSLIKSPGKEEFEKGQVKLELGKQQNAYDLSGVEESLSLEGVVPKTNEKTTVDSKPALKVVQEAPSGEVTSYFIEKEYRQVYFISIYGDQTGENEKPVQQILSTFKFDWLTASKFL